MHFKPKKSLGQNFLIDQNIQRKIIGACNFNSSDIVLEIGAGRGELTRLIAPLVKKVYALELDTDLCGILKDNLSAYSNAEIINQDVLKLNFYRRFRKLENKLNVIGNIPYYIATPILERLIKFREIIEEIYVTVQKEFAARIIARPGSKDYGSLSCFLQYYCEPKINLLIKKTCFLPSPKVDSCFLSLKIRGKLPLDLKTERRFFRITRAAFNQRRKTLRNSLKDVIPQQKLYAFFKEYNINANVRPEELTISDFLHLANL